MKYFSILQPWLEPGYQLIAQPPPGYDPGDTAQREGMLVVAAQILNKMGNMDAMEYDMIKDRYEHVLNLLNDPNHPGLIRRYPDPNYWGGLSDRLSRDQSTPNVIGMGFMNQKRLKMFWDGHTKYSWRWFTTNTRRNWAWPPGHPDYNPKEYAWKLPDITVMSFSGFYIRGFKNRDLWSKAKLWWYDLDMMFGSILKCIQYGKDPENSDDLNHIVGMYQAEMESPTLFSKLAMYIYHKWRPFPRQWGLSRPVPIAKNPAQACMNHYFAGTPGYDGPKINEVYAEICDYMWDTFSWKLKNKF